jgi:hypothetical protein
MASESFLSPIVIDNVSAEAVEWSAASRWLTTSCGHRARA